MGVQPYSSVELWGFRFGANQAELTEFLRLPGFWIAAEALECGARLVTYDTHFEFVHGLLTLAACRSGGAGERDGKVDFVETQGSKARKTALASQARFVASRARTPTENLHSTTLAVDPDPVAIRNVDTLECDTTLDFKRVLRQNLLRLRQ